MVKTRPFPLFRVHFLPTTTTVAGREGEKGVRGEEGATEWLRMRTSRPCAQYGQIHAINSLFIRLKYTSQAIMLYSQELKVDLGK